MIYSVEALVNLSALNHNLQQVRRLAPKSKVVAMIKSNGYGHGILQVAESLQDADAFGIACLSEAIMLRNNSINKRMLLMRGFGNVDELFTAIENDLDLVVHDVMQLAILEQTKLVKPITVWMKIDTGMHRLGFLFNQAKDAYQRLHVNPNVAQPMNIMTHLASADDLTNPFTQSQLDRFQAAIASFPGPKSIANSAGIINWPSAHADWVRPGIILYGVSPIINTAGCDFNLKPVMTLKSKLIAVKTMPKGERVGYGSTWEAPEKMPIGVIAVGYGDGYPRHAESGTPVLLGDTICPLIGRVSMDMITVDLRNKPSAKCGDCAVLWGDGLPIEHVAKCANTIAYDLLCGVTSRVVFKYLS
jgi:alanine racemase